MEYHVKRATVCPELAGLWDGPAWGQTEAITVDNFRPESSDHRPKVQAKLLFDAETIYGIFYVEDKYVRAVHTGYQESVCKDSCVEFFVKPKPDEGYFNFEFSACGAFLVHYVTDATRQPGGDCKAFVELTEQDGDLVKVYHSLPGRIEPEIEEDTEWVLEFAIPCQLLEKYVGSLGDPAGQMWRANFYKCGDATSHPHWASWMPLPKTNFHQPEYFGTLRFAE
jgi:hypothetical protein